MVLPVHGRLVRHRPGREGVPGLDWIRDVGLVGPGRQEIRLHWLPPIPVNVEDLSDLPAVVRPVE